MTDRSITGQPLMYMPDDRGDGRAPKQEQPKKASNLASRRFHEINTFLDKTARTLDPTAVAIWVMLWRDTRSGTATSAHSWIADRLGLSRETVSRHMKTLREAGLVTVVQQGGMAHGGRISRVKISALRSD